MVDGGHPGGDADGTDHDALAACYRRDYAHLVRLARLLVSHGGDAEEVVQEAFVRTYANRRSVRSADPLPYVRVAVVNLARGRLRRRGTRRRFEDDTADANEVASAVDSTEVAATTARASELRTAVAALPRRQREAVVLRYFEEPSTAEAATAMGCSEGSVKAYLHRAIETLRATEVER